MYVFLEGWTWFPSWESSVAKLLVRGWPSFLRFQSPIKDNREKRHLCGDLGASAAFLGSISSGKSPQPWLYCNDDVKSAQVLRVRRPGMD